MFRPRTFQRAFRDISRQFESRSNFHPNFQQRRTFIRLPGGGPQYQRFGNNRSNFIWRWVASPRFYKDVGVISVGAGGFYLYNTETVPISGRRRFNIISPDLEAELSEGAMDEIKAQYQGQFLSDWDPRVRKVRKVLERLLPYVQGAGLESVDWEVHVIDAPEQNAFVIPGGKIFVFTGILPLCRNEDGLAAVLAHEIAHVVAHHPAERMSQAPFLMLGMLTLWLFSGIPLFSVQSMFELIFSLPGSRKQEAEADYIGLMMMAQGCYRPEAAAEFWLRMEKVGQAAPPQVLSTHPSNHNRFEQIKNWLPQAHEKQNMSDCGNLGTYVDQFASAFGKEMPTIVPW